MKTCRECKERLPLEDFYVVDKVTGTTKGACKRCYKLLRKGSHVTKEEFETTKDIFRKEKYLKAKDSSLKRKYGITLEEHDLMLIDQDYKCPICCCCLKENMSVVEHDHNTGVVRAICCQPCNLVLGHAKDNVTTLKNAVKYLEENS